MERIQKLSEGQGVPLLLPQFLIICLFVSHSIYFFCFYFEIKKNWVMISLKNYEVCRFIYYLKNFIINIEPFPFNGISRSISPPCPLMIERANGKPIPNPASFVEY